MENSEFIKIIDRKIEKTKACDGYEEFKKDVIILKLARTGCGLSAFSAAICLHQIYEMSENDLSAYVERYKAGDINVWGHFIQNNE